ncbi:MAG: site-specific integrase [Chitinophagaceae bacterium]|nr:MAG: site-specific integrase [Chitinophagaceae bacterium]
MKLPKYAKLKRGVVYYQRRVPLDVLHAEPFKSMPKVFERSLKTGDLTEALREFADVHEWFERQLGAARAGTAAVDDPMPMSMEDRAVPRKRDKRWAAFYAKEEFDRIVQSTRLRLLDERRGIEGGAEHLEDHLDFEIADLNSQLPDLRSRRFSTVRRAALRIFSNERVIRLPQTTKPTDLRAYRRRHPIEDTEAYHLLCDALITARLEAYDALQLEFAGGIETYVPKSETLRTAPRDLDEDKKYDIAEIARQLIEASPKATKTWLGRLQLMPEIWKQFGLPTDIRHITKAHGVDLMEKLAKCPANKTQRFPGLTWPEALEANKVAGEPTLHPNSLKNAYFAPLTRIFSYAEDKDLVPRNLIRGLAISGVDTDDRGTHFEVDELNTMLQLPQFTGCRSMEAINEPGPLLLDDHWFWAPLVALFSGARTAEIAQLRVNELIFTGPAPYFRIQSDESRRVKTRAGNRTVPVHPILIKIGFKEFVARVQSSGADRLFPNWEKPSVGAGFADAPSQRHFRRSVIPAISAQTSPRPTFHSFRHTMKSEMSACGVPTQQQDAILGHKRSSMDRKYLTKKFTVSVLAASMNKVTFEGLKVDHLFGTRVKVSTHLHTRTTGT